MGQTGVGGGRLCLHARRAGEESRYDLDDLETDKHASLGIQSLDCLAEGSRAQEVHDLHQHMQLSMQLADPALHSSLRAT